MARMLFRYKETFMIWRIYEGFKSSIKNLNPFEKKLWLLSGSPGFAKCYALGASASVAILPMNFQGYSTFI